MHMKKYIIKSTSGFLMFLMLAGFFAASLLTSCDDDKEKDHVPEIHYIRLTDPEKSDSLLARAYLGNIIAIIGDNLQDVTEIWFNDQPAKLIVNYITPTSIIVTIPSRIPEVVTNELRMITRGGSEIVYEFFVDVPPPSINSMLCEFVDTDDIAVIKGNFFIDDENVPLEVYFPGNILGEVEEVFLNEIHVRVPEGAGVGPLTVNTIYGSSRSSFYFRDDRGIILDWDNLNANGGWRSGNLRDSDPVEGLDGKYVLFQGDLDGEAGESWNEDGFSFNLWGVANGRPEGDLFNIPASDAIIKFEIYVLEEWSAHALQMIFTPWDVKDDNSYIADGSTPRGLWYPWKETGSYKTDGWVTVSLPLRDFLFSHEGTAVATAPPGEGNYGGLTFFIYHGGIDGQDCSPVIAIDNIRVVPAE